MYEKLRKERNHRNRTCDYMATLLGLTKATYSKKENGIVKFSLEEAKTIADDFEMTINELFFANEVSKMETKQNSKAG